MFPEDGFEVCYKSVTLESLVRNATSKWEIPYFIKKIYGKQKHKSIKGLWQAGYELKLGTQF